MSAHRNRYKNAALDLQEMRRRREEDGIQLRKQKREQQLIKRRNVDLAGGDEIANSSTTQEVTINSCQLFENSENNV